MPNKTKKPDRTRITVQIPRDLKAKLEAAAVADHRTLSSWVVATLATAVAKGGR